MGKKFFVTFQICLLTTSVYIGSAIYTAGIVEIEQQFAVSQVKALLGLTLFICGYGLGPMIWVSIDRNVRARRFTDWLETGSVIRDAVLRSQPNISWDTSCFCGFATCRHLRQELWHALGVSLHHGLRGFPSVSDRWCKHFRCVVALYDPQRLTDLQTCMRQISVRTVYQFGVSRQFLGQCSALW